MNDHLKHGLSKEELIKYEIPVWAEFVSIGWLQDIIAKCISRKVSRKYKRYVYRKMDSL